MTGCIWLSIGTSGGICEHDNEPSGSIRDAEFLDYLSNYRLLKNDSALWR
jgi:hypothetical protein